MRSTIHPGGVIQLLLLLEGRRERDTEQGQVGLAPDVFLNLSGFC